MAEDVSSDAQAGRGQVESGTTPAGLLRHIVERLQAGAVLVKGGRLFMNEAAEQITGYRADELQTTEAWFATLFGEREPEIRQLYDRHRQSGFMERVPVQINHKGGQVRTVRFAAHRFDDHELWLLHDETERARSESALQESESRLRAVVDTAVEGIVTIDRRGVVLSFNGAAERMLGYSAVEVVGQNISMLMPSPFREEHDSYIDRYLETGKAKIIGAGREAIAQRKDGSVIPVELAVSEIEHLHMFTGIIRDISERKESEDRLRQADRLSSIGTLAAGLGHDMNNVLLPVRARLDYLDHVELPAKVREQFVEIRKSAKYLQDLADGLHLLALDPDDPDASTETTDLEAWWQQTHTLLQRALPKRVRFSASLASDLPPVCIAPHRLTQAVLNLLVNSGKAVAEDGNVRFWAEADADQRIVRLGVTDDGCGMSDEVRRRACEPFFTTKKRGLGTGLGLSLVHGVVLAAGGTLDIDSTPGKGASITLTLPSVAGFELNGPLDAEQVPLRAVVSVDDPRLESLVVSLLEMAGLVVDRLDRSTLIGAGDGDDSETPHRRDVAVWVTETWDGAAATIQDSIRRGCSVILIGAGSDDCRDMGVHVVGNANDFNELRAAIGRAIEGARA